MKAHDLYYELDGQPSLLVTDLIRNVSEMMARSNKQYQLTSPADETIYVTHEALPLNLLEIHNRGRVAAEYAHTRLRRAALQQHWSISDLAGRRRQFASPELAIEGGRFVIHLGSYLENIDHRLELTVSLVSTTDRLMFVKDRVMHSCIAERVFNGFDSDRISSEPIVDVICNCMEDMSTDIEPESSEDGEVSCFSLTSITTQIRLIVVGRI